MGRIRTIKPDLFLHSELFDAEKETGLPLRLAWCGLFTACDREGRFKWKPRDLKASILPYDDCDFSRVLDAYVTRGFVVKYTVDGKDYGFIPTWKEHQIINNRESDSTIPENPVTRAVTRESGVSDAPLGEGKGKERKGKEGSTRDALDPEMVAKAVQVEAGIFGEKAMRMLSEVAKREIGLGIPAQAVAVAMTDAWREYGAIAEKLEFHWGAEKFYGEGHWKSQAKWPWKPGCKLKAKAHDAVGEVQAMLAKAEAEKQVRHV